MKTAKWLLLFCLLPAGLLAGDLPGNPIYHINSEWRDQNNQLRDIDDFRGNVQVLAFVYTYCEHSCPIIVANLKRVEVKLTEAQKSSTQIMLVSLDPMRDTPETLNCYMQDHNMKSGEWNMLNGDPDDVLELSALVGVRYRPMDTEGTDIAHSNIITVPDKAGRIHYQMKGLDESLDGVVAAIESAVKK